jgi:hypothetical protein
MSSRSKEINEDGLRQIKSLLTKEPDDINNIVNSLYSKATITQYEMKKLSKSIEKTLL